MEDFKGWVARNKKKAVAILTAAAAAITAALAFVNDLREILGGGAL
jgi:hypothetical protein